MWFRRPRSLGAENVREVIRKAQADRMRHVATGALACWAFIATVAVVAGIVQARDTHVAVQKSDKALRKAQTTLASLGVTQARQHEALVEGCERLNVLRATSNGTSEAQYLIDKLFVAGIRAQPPRDQTAQQRRLTREFLAIERQALRSVSWTPLTNCVLAIATKGPAYKVPLPIPFAVEKPPPSATDPSNAALPRPAGSRS